MEVGSSVVEASSSGAFTQQQREREVDAVMFQVLDNPSLREEILKHAILGKGKVDRKAACTLRLVDKSWNESVVGILRKAHQHLFQLHGSTRKAVDKFVATFSASEEIMGSIPPLAIPDFGELKLRRPGKLQGFANCLTQCASGLIRVGFTITENGRPVQNSPLPLNLSLPRLHRLDIILDEDDLPDGQSEEQGQVTGDKLSTCLLNSVFSNAPALKVLSLVILPTERPQFTPLGSVILPPSISTIKICTVDGPTQSMEILAKSPLPNLASLIIVYLESELFSEGLLSRILNNCRRSLKTFKFAGNDDGGQPATAHVTRFPVMEQLQELYMFDVNIQPDLGRDSLGKIFPKLATLHLPTQNTNMFQKWLGSSPVPGVTKLRLSLCQNSGGSLNGETMQRVNFVFPHLRKLEMTMSSEDSSGLEYVFREMRQLTQLDIKVECNAERSTCSDIWDSLFTGVPVEVIARSKEDPDSWERSNVLEDENLTSIINLTELKKCSLKFEVHGGASVLPSISDFVFNFALRRMPKLKEFHLGRLSSHNVSEEMIVKWRNDGRSLTFY